MCYANVKLDNLPFLTCRLSLRFGHWLDGSTFNLGFLGAGTFDLGTSGRRHFRSGHFLDVGTFDLRASGRRHLRSEGLLWLGKFWAASLQCFVLLQIFFEEVCIIFVL